MAYAPKFDALLSPSPRKQNAPKVEIPAEAYSKLKEATHYCPRCTSWLPLRLFITKPKTQRTPHSVCNGCRGDE